MTINNYFPICGKQLTFIIRGLITFVDRDNRSIACLVDNIFVLVLADRSVFHPFGASCPLFFRNGQILGLSPIRHRAKIIMVLHAYLNSYGCQTLLSKESQPSNFVFGSLTINL